MTKRKRKKKVNKYFTTKKGVGETATKIHILSKKCWCKPVVVKVKKIDHWKLFKLLTKKPKEWIKKFI